MSDRDQNPSTQALKLDLLLGDVSELKDSVKELTRAVNRLAVFEERLANTSDSLGRAFKAIESQDTRLKVIEQRQPMNDQAGGIIRDVVKFIFMAVLAALVSTVLVNKQSKAAIMPTAKQGYPVPSSESRPKE